MCATVLGQEASLTRRIEPLVQRVEAGLWDAAVMVDECELRRQEAAAATSTLCAQLSRSTEGAVRGGAVPLACATAARCFAGWAGRVCHAATNAQSIERPCRRRNRVLNHHHRIIMITTQSIMSGTVGEYQSLGGTWLHQYASSQEEKVASLGAELAETAAALRDAQVIFGIEAPCSPLTRDCQCLGPPRRLTITACAFGRPSIPCRGGLLGSTRRRVVCAERVGHRQQRLN